MNENFTREQVLKAVAAAWNDANANRHGNPFVALEAVLAARGGGLMATIDLNFTLDYCKRWGMREAVREVIQNARDVELQGGGPAPAGAGHHAAQRRGGGRGAA
jgi:hypothetical protein